MIHPIRTLFAFSRPHTMMGTAISVPAIGAYAGECAAMSGALPAALLANFYVTGLNQMTDVSIDYINKPNLPIASNQMSMTEARNAILISAVLSIIASWHSRALMATTASSMVLGTLYSSEPFRFKRNPVLAAMSIIIVRGIIVNTGFFCYALKSFAFPKGIVFFFSIFASLIAAMKDTPDTEGDMLHDIPSFAIAHGRRRIFWISAIIFNILLISTAIVMHSYASIACIILVTLMNMNTETAIAMQTDTQEAATELYKTYWKCFYICYIGLFFVG